jgi:hypothetical protein
VCVGGGGRHGYIFRIMVIFQLWIMAINVLMAMIHSSKMTVILNFFLTMTMIQETFLKMHLCLNQ